MVNYPLTNYQQCKSKLDILSDPKRLHDEHPYLLYLFFFSFTYVSTLHILFYLRKYRIKKRNEAIFNYSIAYFSIAVTSGARNNFCTHRRLGVDNLQFCAEDSQKQKRHWPELLENMQRCRWALLWGHWPPRLSWNMTGAAAGHCISDCSGPRCWSGGAAADDYITLVTRSTTQPH